MAHINVLYPLIIAVMVDRLLGEPPDRFHSTVWIGEFSGIIRRHLKNSFTHGIFLVLAVAVISSTIAFCLIALSELRVLTLLLAAAVLKLQFSWKGLSDYAMPVVKELGRDIEKAKERLKYLVGRDTDELDEPGVISATIESVAEGTSDSVIAPLFYYLLFGALFGLPAGVAASVFYRAVNTLDSMYGYKKEGTERIGAAPARVDDVLNFLPARITAFFIILSSLALRGNFRGAVKTFKRDRNNTKSPNSGQPMAAMAGALGVRLEKPGHHTLGGMLGEPQVSDIKRAINLSNLATVLFLFVSTVIIL